MSKWKKIGNGSLITGMSVAVVLLVVFLVFRLGVTPVESLAEPCLADDESIAGTVDSFGIAEGDYRVETGVVQAGQTLSHILSGFHLSPLEIDQVSTMTRDVFDPRHIRQGQSYHGYVDTGGEASLRCFIYEISATEFLRVDVEDGVRAVRHRREVQPVQKAATGVIHSSLWRTLSAAGLNPELAIRMSQVLAWEVDFYRIQAGDVFKVIYQEDYVGERPVGISRVDAIYFMHHGREIYGFYFEQDTVRGFYNAEGENLRKAFLRAPLEYVRISSRYSHSRLHPILGHRRPHLGTDYAAPHGTPILAVGEGVVTRAAYDGGNGNYVRIRHNSVYETQYLHMSRFAAGIRPGTRVEQGQVIGYVGSTGLATGPHVCFRFWKNGQQVDHLREEFPAADPLPGDYHEPFAAVRERLIQVLDPLCHDYAGL